MNEVVVLPTSRLPALADGGLAPFFDGPIAHPQDDPAIHAMVRRNLGNPAGAALANCLMANQYPLIGFAYGDYQMQAGVLTPGYRAFACAVALSDSEVVVSPMLSTSKAKTHLARVLRSKAIRNLQRNFRSVYVVTTEQRVQDRDHILACGRGRTDGFISHDRAVEIDEIFNSATAFGSNGGIIVFDRDRAEPLALKSIRGATRPPNIIERVLRTIELAFPQLLRRAVNSAVSPANSVHGDDDAEADDEDRVSGKSAARNR